MARWRDIRRGRELQEALQNYENYQSRPLADRTITRRGYSLNKDFGVVKPFGFNLTTDQWYEAPVVARSRGIAELTSAIGNRWRDGNVLTGTPEFVTRRTYKPAYVSFFKGTGTSVDARSRYTQRAYTRRVGDTYGHPFGQLSDTEREGEAVAAITIALNSANNNVSFRPEKIG